MLKTVIEKKVLFLKISSIPIANHKRKQIKNEKTNIN